MCWIFEHDLTSAYARGWGISWNDILEHHLDETTLNSFEHLDYILKYPLQSLGLNAMDFPH